MGLPLGSGCLLKAWRAREGPIECDVYCKVTKDVFGPDVANVSENVGERSKARFLRIAFQARAFKLVMISTLKTCLDSCGLLQRVPDGTGHLSVLDLDHVSRHWRLV